MIKKTLPVVILLSAAMMLLSGCSRPNPPSVGGFIDSFNETDLTEVIHITDFLSHTQDEMENYSRFFAFDDCELMLQISSLDGMDRICRCSLTYEGIPLTGSDAENFYQIAIASIVAMTGCETQEAMTTAESLNITPAASGKEEKHISNEEYRFYFIPSDIGGSFIFESIRFIEEQQIEKPDAKNYSQFFQTSGQ